MLICVNLEGSYKQHVLSFKLEDYLTLLSISVFSADIGFMSVFVKVA